MGYTMEYTEFLKTKQLKVESSGFDVDISELHPSLFDFQKDIVKWALKKGKCAIFAGTGLGKTYMQLEWANKVCEYTNGNVLILAPLAVAQQTVHEGDKFNIAVHLCRQQSDVKDGINITNYEMLHKFDIDSFIGIVLDESSILKSFTGKVRTQLIEDFQEIPYRLACTATPAPNDYMELGNHSEFLGVMSVVEMFAMFFVHDGGDTAKWRLKGHAVKEFWEWVSSWAVMLSNPRDLGYDGEMFDLPELKIHEVQVDKTGYVVKLAQTLTERRDARRSTIDARVKYAADIANSLNEPCIVWCDLNEESDKLTKAINGAVEVKGSHDNKYKEDSLTGFSEGKFNILVSKPSIAGFGMNWQHCSKMIFVGISDSFEQYYQAVRRCWRFGQLKEVDVYIITSVKEGAVVANIKRKEKEFNKMLSGMIASTQDFTKKNIKSTQQVKDVYAMDTREGVNWKMNLGDTVEITENMQDKSVDFIMFSPPFSSLYTYSNSTRDMGNCKTDEEFASHFNYLAKHLFRVLKDGRLMSVHCMNLPTSKVRDGYIGIKDFRGELIRLFTDFGFIYHSEVCIWKDPVTSMQRTKALGLLHKQIKKDSTMSRQGIPDYIVTFRKPGINENPVTHTNDSFPVSVWQNYASPVWMDINPSDTLQKDSAREHEDERHICPLQLTVIQRCIELWTNERDIVFDPFAGIGSTLYQAVIMNRQGLGNELKQSYYNQACKNLDRADKLVKAPKQVGLDYGYACPNQSTLDEC